MQAATNQISYQPPHSEQTYTIQDSGPSCLILEEGKDILSAVMERMQPHLRVMIKLESEKINNPYLSIIVLLDYLFGRDSSLQFISIKAPSLVTDDKGFHNFLDQSKDIHMSRSEFYQLPAAWHYTHAYSPNTERWTQTDGRSHPVRPDIKLRQRTISQPETVYRRYLPSIKKTLTFRTVDIDRDLNVFHNWHNQPRVYDLWELNQPKEELRNYLVRGLNNPHQFPLIMEFDGEPAGYFEVYWAAEDRLGPYYDYQPYDRGFHFLIGNAKYLGVENTGAAVRSIMHFIYLDDVRTRRIMAEPRSDNQKVLKYVQLVPGWQFIREFDFPHKRAALLMANREDFFEGGAL